MELTVDEMKLSANVLDAYNRHILEDKIDEHGIQIINQEELDALKSIIALCKENNWIPIMITTPFTSEYNDYIWRESPEYMEAIYSLIYDVAEETGVEYFDYSRDARFCSNHNLFLDGDHLNKEGGRLFVDVINDEVIKKIK